jgi:2-C-methyl-D-erythritol 2,4-cyclodiphosphate synthase
LRLGGVTVPFEMGLAGHSDGDVLLHAISDALLGAAALDDLGRHFPSSDDAYAGIDSGLLLRRVVEMLREHGWVTEFVDATIVAQRPRLSPFQSDIAASIASLLELSPGSVNVKVTSTDRVGAIGKGEGIAAQAIATIRRT